MDTTCLVIPCFNEERRLDGARIASFLSQEPGAHVCFVDDGSTDGTLRVLREIAAGRGEQTTTLPLPANVGKAEAVRRGLLQMSSAGPFQYLGYWDADLSTPLDEARPMIQLLRERHECVMVLASRVKRLGSHVERRAIRHLLGRVFATAASMSLALPVYDSQCGAKMFRVAAVPELFAEPFVSRWLFDVEILARLRRLVGDDAIVNGAAIELPVRAWREVPGSKLRLRDMLDVPRELWRIRRHYAVDGGRRSRAESGRGAADRKQR